MANVIRQAVGEMVLRCFPWAFMLMGLVVVGYCTQKIVRGWQCAGWPVTEGRVEVCAVEVANGGTSDEASYAVKVRYVFSVDEREYRSDRVSFGKPVFKSQEEAITAAAQYPVERTVKVHYHSKTPELCVIMPGSHGTVWIGFVVGIVFFLMGVGIFFLLRIVKNKPRAKGIGMVPKPQSPPWEHRRWHGGVARDDYAWVLGVVLLIIGGGFLGMATAFAISMGKRILHEEWFAGLLLLVFMVCGIGALIGAFISLARWWRFGGARVRMTTLPGVIGGHFSGEVELPDSLPANANVHIELVCAVTRSSPGRGSDDGSTSISKEWSQKICTKPADRQHRGRQWHIPFDFTIPYQTNGNEVLHDETNNGQLEGGVSVKYRWWLRVTAKLPGPDLNLNCHVPVFKTAASNCKLNHVPEIGAELPLEQYLAEKDEPRRVCIEAGPGGPVFVGAVRPIMWSAVLAPTILGVAFTAAGIGIPISVWTDLAKDLHVPKDGLDLLGLLLPLGLLAIPTLISVVCFALGSFLSMVSIGSFISRRTWVERGMIRQTRTFLGIPLLPRSVPCSQVDRVDTNGSSSSDGKSFSTVAIWFKGKDHRAEEHGLLAFVLKLAVSMTVGTDIPTRREADALIAALREEINRQRYVPLEKDDENDNEPE